MVIFAEWESFALFFFILYEHRKKLISLLATYLHRTVVTIIIYSINESEVLTVSSGWQISSLSISLMRKTTKGYARRGGAPRSSGGFGDLRTIIFSPCGS